MSQSNKDFTLPDFSGKRIIIYGDLILDRYWYSDVNRISPEGPVPVASVKQRELRPGGAANVAVNVAALGAHVDLFGCVGNDKQADELRSLLDDHDITCHFLVVDEQTTTSKLRLIGQHQQLIRMDFDGDYSGVNKSSLIAAYEAALYQSDAVILSDYAKGVLSDITTLIQHATHAKRPVFIDPKHSDVSQYKGATLLTPNRKEFELIAGVCRSRDDMMARATAILKKEAISGLLITLGEDGMLLVEQGKEPYHVPTQAQQVFDVTGAGDTVIALFALMYADTKNMPLAAYLANVGAGISITKLGAATVSPQELQDALHKTTVSKNGVTSELELMDCIAKAHVAGEKVVMTNGCFDILHSGHVHYLEQAKKLGNRLIIAVNDDASVHKLKGGCRPL